MRIKVTTNISSKTSSTLLTKIKNFFYKKSFGLKSLLKDVFEKSNPNIALEKSVSTKNMPRKLPNSISAKDEKFAIGGGTKVKFYKEDLEKMKRMTIDEKLKYTEYLIEKGFYDL